MGKEGRFDHESRGLAQFIYRLPTLVMFYSMANGCGYPRNSEYADRSTT